MDEADKSEKQQKKEAEEDIDLGSNDLIDVVVDTDEEVNILNLTEKEEIVYTTEEITKPGTKHKRKHKTLTNLCDNVGDSSDEEIDKDSPEAVANRLRSGCECSSNCFKGLDPDKVYKHRLNIAELTKNEHDMYLMGVTMACMANSSTTSRQKIRQRQRASYVYQGKRVCLDAFLFLENVSLYHIKRIRNHVLLHGVTPRSHGNLGRKAHNAFSLDVYRNVEEYVRKFLKPYIADANKSQIVYGINRSDVYYSYREHGRKADEKLMGYSTFRHFMKKQFPQIKFQRVDYSGKHGGGAAAAVAAAGDSGGTPKGGKKSNKKEKSTTKEKVPLKLNSAQILLNIDASGKIVGEREENILQNTETTYILAPIEIDSSLITVVSESIPVIEASEQS